MSNRVRLLSLLFVFAVFLLILSGVAVADEPPNGVPAKSAPKWEYKTVKLSFTASPEYMDKSFNELGDQGWELVTSNAVTFASGGQTNYVFKRPKR